MSDLALVYDEQRGVQVLQGTGTPQQKTFNETAKLIIENLSALDPTQVVECIVFAEQLNCIEQELFQTVVNKLLSMQLDYSTVCRLVSFTTFFKRNIFVSVTYEEEIWLLSQVNNSDYFIKATFDLIVELKDDSQMTAFITWLPSAPIFKQFCDVEYLTGLNDTEEVNLLLFCVIIGVDITQIIQPQEKLHSTILEMEKHIEHREELVSEPNVAIKANLMYRSFQLFDYGSNHTTQSFSNIIELSPLLILVYRKSWETRHEVLGRIVFGLVATERLSIEQIVCLFDCLEYAGYLDAEEFPVIFEQVATQYELSLNEEEQIANLSQVCENDIQICSYQALAEKLLMSDIIISRRSALTIFEEAVEYPALANAAVEFLAKREIPMPFASGLISIDAELRKYLEREYGELYFELAFPLVEHKKMVAFLEEIVKIDVSNVIIAYSMFSEIFHEGRTTAATEIECLNCKQALVLLYFLFMRDHYLCDDVEMQRKDAKTFEEKGRFMNATDEYMFELMFIENGLHQNERLNSCAFEIARSPLLACQCIEQGTLQEYDFSGSPIGEHYSFLNRRIEDLMNLIHIVAVEELDIPIDKPLELLKEQLEYESCAVNSLCLLAFFQLSGFLNLSKVRILHFATDFQTAQLYSEYLPPTETQELGGSHEPIRLNQAEEVEVPQYDSPLKHHSLYCYQTNSFIHSQSAMEEYCDPQRIIDVNLEYGYFVRHATLELHQLSSFIDDYAWQYVHALNGLIFAQENIYLASNEFVLLVTHILVDICELLAYMQTFKEPSSSKQLKIRILSQRPSRPSDFNKYMEEIHLKVFKLHTSIVSEFCDVFRHFSPSEPRKVHTELLSNKCQILPRQILERVAEYESQETLAALYEAFENEHFLENKLRHFEFRSNNTIGDILVRAAVKERDFSFLHSFSRNDEAYVLVSEVISENSEIDPYLLKQVNIDKQPLEAFDKEKRPASYQLGGTVCLTGVVKRLFDFALEDERSGALFASATWILSTFDSTKLVLPLRMFFAFYGDSKLCEIEDIPQAIFGEEQLPSESTNFSTHSLERVARACLIDVMFIGVQAGAQFELGKDRLVRRGVLEGPYSKI